MTIDSSEAKAKTKTKAAETMNGNAQILAMVYKMDGKPHQYSFLTPSSNAIYLPQGYAFKIVFYSYNSETAPNIRFSGTTVPDGNGGYFVTGGSFMDLEEDNSRSAMYFRIEDTGVISQTTKLPRVVFEPMFSRMQWKLVSDNPVKSFSISNANLRYTYGQATVYTSKLATALGLQELWQGRGNSNTDVPIVFKPASGTSIASGKHIVLPREDGVALSGRITIESGTSRDVNLAYRVDPGKSYTITSKVVIADYGVTFGAEDGGSVTPSGLKIGLLDQIITSQALVNEGYIFAGWYVDGAMITATSGNVSVSGTTLNVRLNSNTSKKVYTAKFAQITPRIYVEGSGASGKLMLTQDPRIYGAFFQFGSILAWSGTGPLALLWNPSELPSSWQIDWHVRESFPAHSIQNLQKWKGDPCRLVGYTQDEIQRMLQNKLLPDNGEWRLPTQKENQAFVAAGKSGSTTSNGVPGFYLGLGASKGGKGGQFMPASGNRDFRNGELKSGRSAYWSSPGIWSDFDDLWIGTGFLLYPDADDVRLNENLLPDYGYNVRCVRR